MARRRRILIEADVCRTHLASITFTVAEVQMCSVSGERSYLQVFTNPHGWLSIRGRSDGKISPANTINQSASSGGGFKTNNQLEKYYFL